MKGSIRVITGLVIAAGGVGGVENSMTNVELLIASAIALAGLAVMASGVNAVKKYYGY